MNKKELLQKYSDREFDRVIFAIKSGAIQTGKYAKIVKVNKDAKINRKEMFPSERSEDGKGK